MTQLDLFYSANLSANLMNWPNDFDGAHSIGPVDFGLVTRFLDEKGEHIKDGISDKFKGSMLFVQVFGVDAWSATLLAHSLRKQT